MGRCRRSPALDLRFRSRNPHRGTEEYKILAERFEQKPTVKAIQERITKLRVEVRRVLKETGIFDPERVAQPPPRGPTTPGQ